ncbi:uncharacterized protein si:dkey-182g1.3 [Danio aesculapii]|uniref:uncharacterized protein si:dkey-182g1.3 n=1 Tax=Danio aesculapii TaxID=1142201 RepID=UPI0024C01A44|nr:uncharacterized protein si:dkey-182g1.3 [Danio aesculapii]
MQMIFLSVCFLLLRGAFGAEETVSVMEGDSVTLQTNLTEILNTDTLLWAFGAKEIAVSQITRKDDLTSIYITEDERFNDRVLVDQKTGSITIRNIRIKHFGKYKLTISREKTTTKTFRVTVFAVVRETDGVKSLSVMEGDSVSLQKDSTELQKGDLIVWRFGDKGLLLAKLDVETNETSLNADDERFRDRLKLDYQTGSLTIRNARTEHTGLYEIQIRGRESIQQFLLSVSTPPQPRLPAGAIAGIIIAVLLVAACVTVIIVYYYRRKVSRLEHMVEVKVKDKVIEKEGRTLCLKTGMDPQKDDEIKWWFNTQLIANFSGEQFTSNEGDHARFKGKLSAADKYGDLLIRNIRSIHSGVYKVEAKGKTKIFIVTVEDNEVPVEVGGTLTLNPGVKTLPGDLILWTIGAAHQLIKAESGEISSNNDRYRGRLELIPQTGALTITNMTNEDYGYFHLQIINKERTRFRRFKVIEKTSRGNHSKKQSEEMKLLQQGASSDP